ncbi:MAG: hypothetical protein AB1489_24270 [Acidobacteriota bacterium]
MFGTCKDKDDNMACSMACCAQAKLPVASPAAQLCCEMGCGKPTNTNSGMHPETVSISQPLASSITTVDIDSFERPMSVDVSTSIQSLDVRFLHRDHHPLYINHVTLLI